MSKSCKRIEGVPADFDEFDELASDEQDDRISSWGTIVGR